ncbi:BRCA1-A complex subunit Abraxas 1 isoform X2 [Sebastes umbrosus]|uniref:BRCA1-A complex subunit Abraxas 1 isoform X2 n=1 Tax=Sebastes umbrosus TaxID=72105 RepID=UPI00189CCA72|nr:BRCA1-A complex subunit Abraxas 1 isoform X2 [Sebastes umbrosus]
MAEQPPLWSVQTVQLSGIVLSSLMFQHVNTDSDVEGLILGETRSDEQITISDSQADHIHIEEIYNIQNHINCQKLNSFYSSVGDVDVDAVKTLLADNKLEKVIGWYRQRRNSEQQMTFREKVVHEKLKTSLSNPHMIFVLLTPSTLTPPGSTHRMEYAAFISRSSSKFFSSNGLLREVNDVNTMNDCLQTQLQTACGEVEESERLVETLQADVSALRRRLREEKKSGTGKDDDPAEQKKKQRLLHEAVRVLFSSPLFHTLTLDGFPVPDVSTATTTTRTQSSDTTGAQETLLHPVRMDCRKRPRERKRRKSPS